MPCVAGISNAMPTVGKTPMALCIVTHHKTGTVWMRKVFSAVSRCLGLPFASAQNPNSAASVRQILNEGPAMLVALNGKIPQLLAQDPGIRFIHMIRDPRDVLLSGLHYHKSHVPRKNSPEKSIHTPRREFGGMTYQQKLCSIKTFQGQLRFEMSRRHNTTVRQMLRWDYTDPRTIEWKYEDMMLDRDGVRFRDAMETAGYGPGACDEMCAAFLTQSIFDQSTKPSVVHEHVTSGRIRRWETEFTPEFSRMYLEKYGAAVRELGYDTGPCHG